MRKNILNLILVTGILYLTACTTMTPAPAPAQNKNVSWDNRVETLSGMKDWNMNALIAIRNNKDDASANLRWQQQKQFYTLNIVGPMGANAYKLSGAPGKLVLQNSRGQLFYAATPEALLNQQTGWQLPVSNLYYWIRGLPVPGIPAKKQFDAYQHLLTLDQSGWHIEYLRYTMANNIDLPTKIFLNSPDLTVKIIINQWQL